MSQAGSPQAGREERRSSPVADRRYLVVTLEPIMSLTRSQIVAMR